MLLETVEHGRRRLKKVDGVIKGGIPELGAVAMGEIFIPDQRNVMSASVHDPILNRSSEVSSAMEQSGGE
jgi:hypothetical protein